MVRPAPYSVAVLLIVLTLCHSGFSQEGRSPASELDIALGKLTSKRAIAEVNRYRKALNKLAADTQKEKGRLRKELLDELDVALRMATKDKDYAETQKLLDARLLLEKANEAEGEGEPNQDQNLDEVGDSDESDSSEARNQTGRVPKRSKEGDVGSEIDSPLTARIPQAAKTFRKNKYLVITEKATWHHAKVVCEKLGGHLVRVDDDEEQKFLEKLATAAGPTGKSHWIDASDEEAESKWHNSLGQPLPYTNWDNGQPNNDNSIQHNAAMRRDLDWKWNDDVSSMRARFICEWEDVAAQE